MKKRILALTLSLVMLLSMAIFPASAAYATDVTFYAPAGTGKVPELISRAGLNATKLAEYRDKVISIGLTKGSSNEDITGGVSVIGATSVAGGSGVSSLTDGVWKSGKWNNARFIFDSGVFYDKTGTAGTAGENGAIYTNIWTINFGQVKSIESFGYISSHTMIPQSADIYVSTNGTDWDLVAYYDYVKAYIDGTTTMVQRTNLSTADGADVWLDSASNALFDGLIIFDLPEIKNAQYIRIAGTTVARNTTVSTNSYKNGDVVTGSNQFYPSEILVFGGDAVAEEPEVSTDIVMDAVQTKDIAGTDSYDARFVAKVKKDAIANAASISFKVSASFTDTNNTTAVDIPARTLTTTTVYTSIMADGNPVAAPDGYYYAVFVLTGIGNDVDVTFTITPEIVYNEGDPATGAAATVTFPSEA